MQYPRSHCISHCSINVAFYAIILLYNYIHLIDNDFFAFHAIGSFWKFGVSSNSFEMFSTCASGTFYVLVNVKTNIDKGDKLCYSHHQNMI